MDNVIVLYLIKASVSLALFYGLYMLCLRTDTFFRLRRGYFLFAIFFSLLYPILILEMPIEEAAPIQMPTYWLSQIDVVAANAEPPAPVVNVWLVILEGLALVSLLYAIKFIIQLFSVVKLRADNKSEKLATCRIIKMKNKETSPFSFFNWIFINIENHTGKELDEIIAHEQIHGRQYHSIDVILAELLCICFWWNPFAWLLKKEMKINLEYLADEGVLKAGFDTAEYQYILLQITNKNTGIPLINNFNVSQLKKRIIMMNKRKTSLGKAVKYLLAVPVVFALLLGNAVQASPDIIDIPFMDGKQVPQKKGDVYTVAEQMPSFAGGEAEMQKFLGNNVKYPVAAQAAGIQGRVVVRFIVGATGEISDVRAIRGVDPELDKEAVRVIKAMPKWKPGKQGGKAVDVYYTLPIVFRLTGNKDKITTKEENAKNVIGYGSAKNGEETNIPADGSKPFITVEQMPSFPGGEAEMQRFLGNNVKYPVAAQAAGIQGRVVVRFIVGATGEISDVRVIRGVDPELDKEAVRVIKAMPKWKPGKQGGKAVNVYFTLPISFRLKGDGDEGDALDQAWAQENDKILLVVDGKIVDIGTLTTIEQNNKVESVSIKRGEEELKKYGDAAKGKDSIMEIKLKK